MAKKVDELVEEVSKLTVIELSELVTALQEKLGISAMPVVAAPASPAQGGSAGEPAAAEEGGLKTVVITASGENKINVIKALREINQNLTLMDAKTATENVPYEVLKDAKVEDAKMASEKLKAAGATVELK